jgi:Raf kinase inhibitor-like YbhB/YbcL family protein
VSRDPYAELPEVPSFTLTSTDIQEGGDLPQASRSGIFPAGGEDRLPQLSWSGFPEGTRSFAVSCYDPEAPTVSGFWHWYAINLPADVTEIAGGSADEEGSGLPAGAIQLMHDAGMRRFLGAAPPAGHGKHRYIFVVHALDVDTVEGVGEDASCALAGFMLLPHTLGRATLTAYSETPPE